MRIERCAAVVCAAVCVQAGNAGAQTRLLTLEEVLARARAQAPQVVSARLALEETRSRLTGASLRFQANPEIDANLGNRQGAESRFTDFELGIRQAFEPAARKAARVAGANAAITEASAGVEDTTRTALRLAASAYYQVLHARERIQLLNAAEALAARVHTVADQRFRAGDIAVLEVNVARSALARVRAEREAADASRLVSTGELKLLLGLEGDVGVTGALARQGDVDLTSVLEAATRRPELRALEAAAQEAEAEARLGRTFAKPDYGVGLRYSREEGDQIVLGGFTISLPVFSKGQELTAASTARAARLRADHEAARLRIQIEVRTAFEVYNRRLAAVRVLEVEALPGLDENETLTTRSFEVGQIGLPDLLLLRREILDTRSQYLDALLEAALARVDLDASAAILR